MSDFLINSIGNYNNNTNISADKLSSKLNSVNTDKATDEELMQVCKDFESYLVEQVMKNMEKTIMKDEDDSSDTAYLDMFGDTMYKEYASKISEQTDFGISKMLYESMKR